MPSKTLKSNHDYILSNWGIEHFHMQERNHCNKYNFDSNANILLLVECNEEIILIDIIKHTKNKGWFKKIRLEEIDNLKPNCLLSISFAKDIINEISDDYDVEEMEKRLIIFLKINNKVVCPNYGCASSGNSNKIVSRAGYICNYINNYQDDVIKKMDVYRNVIKFTSKQYDI